MSITITLKVTPGSGKQKIVVDKNGQLKCYLKNPPEKGKANRELLVFVAKQLGVGVQAIDIIQGLTGRKKVLRINAALTEQDVKVALGIESQQSLW